ncbi:helix-turn-helix domain-containing protein [Novosphingobium sp. Fuku2-ISO-50]|jgi:transcriptional regulator with XRE-family HTH domain|uniref:helix-turn-helix domain-containing protein n=1 Tax=Novosphingobium sp. Fuku2-ISO-50 TaxID=1739114 RepID=UPI00076D3BD7|nr:XRE family transcriptional regulator [Novosphingobium sp. Fuku2-ISO-50]KUR77542.1 XRE family transcriptional regulator [Novosphingobium sp. Fuku2-ISO-50]
MPVTTLPAPDAPSRPGHAGLPPIGAAIRDRRKRLGMTLQVLASASGLSAPFLSQVERDLAMPSLVSLTAIAQALGVEMSYFVGTPPPGQVVRRGNQPELLQVGSGPVVYHRLSGQHEERKMEALHMTVPPGIASPLARREGEGFWYILGGELSVWIGQEHFILGPGDSAHFDQRHPYRMRNDGARDVTMIWVGTPALL